MHPSAELPPSTDAPIIIRGSMLQAIICGACAVGIAVIRRDDLVPVPLLLIIALVIATVVIWWRQWRLYDDHIDIRRIGGSFRANRGAMRAELGHRYLTVYSETGRRARIEVPVEIRPNVRDWAAGINEGQVSDRFDDA